MAGDAPAAGGRPVAAWALAGSAAILVRALVALGARGVATVQGGLGPGEWAALLGLTAAFVYGEGVLALERRWVPHVVERARRLRSHDGLFLRLAAPLYAFSLVGAPPRVLARAWAGVGLIVLAVLVVRAFPEPWRGIVDLAVAAALAWAVVALLRQAPRALR